MRPLEKFPKFLFMFLIIASSSLALNCSQPNPASTPALPSPSPAGTQNGVASGSNWNSTPSNAPGYPVNPTGSTALSYARDIQPIVQSYCLNCHGSRGPAMSTYQDLTRNFQPVWQQVSIGRMPQGRTLPQDSYAKLLSWAQQGYAP